MWSFSFILNLIFFWFSLCSKWSSKGVSFCILNNQFLKSEKPLWRKEFLDRSIHILDIKSLNTFLLIMNDVLIILAAFMNKYKNILRLQSTIFNRSIQKFLYFTLFSRFLIIINTTAILNTVVSFTSSIFVIDACVQ